MTAAPGQEGNELHGTSWSRNLTFLNEILGIVAGPGHITTGAGYGAAEARLGPAGPVPGDAEAMPGPSGSWSGDADAWTWAGAALTAAQASRWEHPPKQSFWHSLTAEDQDALVPLGAEKLFRAGTALCREGDTSSHVMVIASGWTKVSVQTAADQEQIIAVLGPGDLVGERAALTMRSRSATVTALGDVQAMCLTAEGFTAFVEARPRAREILRRHMLERLAENRIRMFAPESATVERRLAFLLFEMARRRGWSERDGTVRITLPMSQQELADWADARPSAVARYLTAWRDRGIIQTAPRLMTVLNAAELEKICGPAPPGQLPQAELPQAAQAQISRAGVTQAQPTQAPQATTPVLGSSPGTLTRRDPAKWAPVHCSILITDVASFSGTGRSEIDRLAVREALHMITQAAFEFSSVPWARCYHEDKGDGALIVIPPAFSVVSVVDPLLADLAARLRRHNRHSSDAIRIQLRAALHMGLVCPDRAGLEGEPLIHAARLIDASILRRELESTGADLALMVSEDVYKAVILHAPGSVDPATYTRVKCRVKGSRITAWMHLAGIPAGPAPEQAPPRIAATARPAPAQLPADVHAFTGRARELAELDRLLAIPAAPDARSRPSDRAGPAGGSSDGSSIAVVSGTAGVGKSALALRWARLARGAFPGGQLYVNLRGYDPGQPVAPADALAGFLRALGTAAHDIPPDEDGRAAAYRTAVDRRRLLIVLDNAATVEQVRPLLPGCPSCAVVVTSRDALSGLVARHGARRLDLDLLPPADAAGLLRALIGERADADPGSAATLAEQCARLPLALRLAAELACDRPATPLAQLVAELTDQRRRLDLLNAGGDPRAIRGVFSWSYRQLPGDAALAFRLLGMHPGPDFDDYATAALTESTYEQAQQVLDQLARAHLIHPTSPGRYGMHDLLRAYASHLTGEENTRGTST